MPRENRKRGKKHKKPQDEDNVDPKVQNERSEHLAPKREEPSWIIAVPVADEEAHAEAPFGYVDPDVKAYFRTVDEQLQNWQEEEYHADNGDEDIDPNEAKRIFFVAALTEMSTKEKQLATDPDCSVIMERMLHSMDDFVRRVFADTLSGSYEILVKHRFASHVCQTLFTIAGETISRESKGIFPEVPESSEKGELRTLTQLILDICDELKPNFTSLVMDPFASHVLRALLLFLSPSIQSSDASNFKSQSNIRSKKSSAWKARQGTMKSFFAESRTKEDSITNKMVPKEFREAAGMFVRALRDELDENEVRALAANKVASPVLQIILEIETDQGGSTVPGCLMDRVLVGIITSYHEDPSAVVEQSDYLTTLLRDPTSSHLLETLVTRSPAPAFSILWSTYFKGKLSRLALHPVANFVVAKAFERIDAGQLQDALNELEGVWSNIIKAARTGVLRALIDRTAVLQAHEGVLCEAVCAAFEVTDPQNRKYLVHCLMLLHPLQEYLSLPPPNQKDGEAENAKKMHRKMAAADPRAPKVQGALLLQSLLRLHEPHNHLVIDSIKALPMEELVSIAHNATSSRVLDAIFESSTVSFKAKRGFVMSLIGHYHTLVDDRIGSRVGDRCWAFADPYLREKIARSLIPYEQFLAASYYGKYFARNLNLYLLQRRPQDWKDMQSENKANMAQTTSETITTPGQLPDKLEEPLNTPQALVDSPKKHKKRKAQPHDEIDVVFDAALGKKTKKANVSVETKDLSVDHHAPKREEGLGEVLDAIKTAPRAENESRKKRRKD
ncbi:armadillo-type protein [Hygrophoropsis aurantiaca]|uniref:Armadillo-type protein n=1 Tax=Hygrophoropsis aurantiaca TaxID=72124 RepID=A0ACB8ARV3_9AGAM|nr:armadillo-type protein [Hygrophoropsis aurantiaca]